MGHLKGVLLKSLYSYVENCKIVESGYILLNFKDVWCALVRELY